MQKIVNSAPVAVRQTPAINICKTVSISARENPDKASIKLTFLPYNIGYDPQIFFFHHQGA